ncbi:MAG: hypothetical protein IH856_22025 [Deltaproteobacteria bacterium]|nr:hypothetical protein [Deltaproteobacteria bacterium]
MSTVFIGGSRRLGRLNDVIRERLDNIVERGLRVVIGDANGSDRAVQAFLSEKKHEDVIVYCMEGTCRNNIGGWPTEEVTASGERGFDYYALKDAEMARKADCGFLIWDGKSKGTLFNVFRLIDSHKPAVVYFSLSKQCSTIRSRDDLIALLDRCPTHDRRRLLATLGKSVDQVALFSSRDSKAG